ncbi:hypothetical protein D3C86_2151910 [compost metagenome]
MQKGSADKTFIRVGIDPDDQIIAFLDHVYGSVLCGDLQPHVRIFDCKTRRDPTHGGLRKQQRRADP